MRVLQCPDSFPFSLLHLHFIIPSVLPDLVRLCGHQAMAQTHTCAPSSPQGSEGRVNFPLKAKCSINPLNANNTLSPKTFLVMKLSCQDLNSQSHLQVIWVAVKRSHKERISCLLNRDRLCPPLGKHTYKYTHITQTRQMKCTHGFRQRYKHVRPHVGVFTNMNLLVHYGTNSDFLIPTENQTHCGPLRCTLTRGADRESGAPSFFNLPITTDDCYT